MKSNEFFVRSITFLIPLVLVFTLSSCLSERDEPTITPMPADYLNQGTVTVNSRNITVCARDWGAIDGDIITILFNGKTLVSKLTLTGSNQCWELKNLPVGDNWIAIIAHDEGYNPPASPGISINDGTRTQNFEIRAYVNKPGGYTIKVQL
jgi:hypothetical protein